MLQRKHFLPFLESSSMSLKSEIQSKGRTSLSPQKDSVTVAPSTRTFISTRILPEVLLRIAEEEYCIP